MRVLVDPSVRGSCILDALVLRANRPDPRLFGVHHVHGTVFVSCVLMPLDCCGHLAGLNIGIEEGRVDTGDSVGCIVAAVADSLA